MSEKIVDIFAKLLVGSSVGVLVVSLFYVLAMVIGAPRTVTYCYVAYDSSGDESRHHLVKANIEWASDETIANARTSEEAQQKLEAMCPLKR